MRRGDLLLVLAVAACLGWAAVEARGLRRSGADPEYRAGPILSPAGIERGFSDVQTALDEGRRDEALLLLRDRATRGPHPGYAAFHLGELAYKDGAYPAAVRHYRTAVETEPAVYDRGAAFRAGRVVTERLRHLREGPWAQEPPPEIRDLYFLQRRIAGGCE